MATAVHIPTSPRGYSLRPNELYVSVDEYLHSMYHPDMDYVDGHLEERNLGEVEHSRLQGALLLALSRNARTWGIEVLPECRLQVKPDRFRIPDILVLSRNVRPDRIVKTAPLLCIEVLSPDDTFKRILYRVDDYIEMGVKNIWVFDPENIGRVFTVVNGERQWTEAHVLEVAGTSISIDLDEISTGLAK